MLLTEFLFALLVAIVITLIFPLGFRRRVVWPGLFLFFMIIFLAAWAGGRWLTPIGPAAFGVFWLSFLVMGIFIALVIAAAAAPRRESTVEMVEGSEERREESAFDVFLGVLLIVLVVGIIVSYL